MTHSWKTFSERGKLLNRARELARSGQHPDHRSIIAQLEPLEEFENARGRLEDSAFRLQLDRLCALARVEAAPGGARARSDLRA